jgi:hypothetical protein
MCTKQLSELQSQGIQKFLQLKVIEAIPKVIPNSLWNPSQPRDLSC